MENENYPNPPAAGISIFAHLPREIERDDFAITLERAVNNKRELTLHATLFIFLLLAHTLARIFSLSKRSGAKYKLLKGSTFHYCKSNFLRQDYSWITIMFVTLWRNFHVRNFVHGRIRRSSGGYVSLQKRCTTKDPRDSYLRISHGRSLNGEMSSAGRRHLPWQIYEDSDWRVLESALDG